MVLLKNIGQVEQSRRDDLESVGYVLMYFLRGELPWQGLRVKSKEDRYRKILEKKKETSSEDLCKNFPHEFYKFVEYTKNLGYEDNPDYEMLKNLFTDVLKKRNDKFDYIYDWTTKSDLSKRKYKKKHNEEESNKDSDKDSTKDKCNIKDEVESNKDDQIDRINSKIIKRRETQEKEDKVESVCCVV